MRTFKQELTVFRGEDFSIDKVLVNGNGAPYIISSKLPNAHLLISVTDTLYSQSDRYVKNYWLSLENVPTFEHTEVLNLADLLNSVNGTRMYSNFSAAAMPLTGYYKGNFVQISADAKGNERSYVYYNEGEGYKYYDGGEWKNYEFRFVKRFSNEDTRQWKAQNYLYTIQLVAGTKSRDYLVNILDDNNVNYVKSIDYIGELTPNDTSTEELYNLAISNGLQLTESFHLGAPIIPSYTTSILKPTKITVKEYAQGDVIW